MGSDHVSHCVDRQSTEVIVVVVVVVVVVVAEDMHEVRGWNGVRYSELVQNFSPSSTF